MYTQAPKVDLHVGDCRDVMRRLEPKSIHTIVTSPPYWNLRDYGVDGQIGLEHSIDEWVRTMVDVFETAREVLRDDGTLWVNLGDKYEKKQLLGTPWRFALAMQEAGWFLRADIIWHKPNPVPEPDRGRPTMAHEYLFLFSKQAKYFYDTDAVRVPSTDAKIATAGPNTGADSDRLGKGYKKNSPTTTHPNGRNIHSVWSIPTYGSPDGHFATFPPKLVIPCISAGTSEAGCCSNCGAPAYRITTPATEYAERLGRSWHDHQHDLARGHRGVPKAFRGGLTKETIEWKTNCDCGAERMPCTVLDPFAGTGTTGKVALDLCRNAVLIELNPEYAKKIEQNTSQSVMPWALAV